MESEVRTFSPVGTMKKLATCAVLCFICLSGYAQSKAFEKLAKIEGVEFVHVDKNMIRQAAESGEGLRIGDNINFGNAKDDIIRLIDDVMVFSCEEAEAVEKLKKSVQKLLKDDKWESLIDMKNEDGETVKICQAKDGDQITSVIFAGEEDDMKLVVINGKLDLAQMMKQQNNNSSEE